jgi:predicted amidophosphoribosyltransferase
MDGKRILLIDDTLTTGAMAQSAASALSNGGATVVGILTMGRMIKPSFSETVNEYW